MGAQSERRRSQETHPFRSAGTHFQFKNGWQVRLLPVEPVGTELYYDVSIYDPDYRALSFGTEAAAQLKKLGSDNLALVLFTVRSFGAATRREKTADYISSLIALSL